MQFQVPGATVEPVFPAPHPARQQRQCDFRVVAIAAAWSAPMLPAMTVILVEKFFSSTCCAPMSGDTAVRRRRARHESAEGGRQAVFGALRGLYLRRCCGTGEHLVEREPSSGNVFPASGQGTMQRHAVTPELSMMVTM